MKFPINPAGRRRVVALVGATVLAASGLVVVGAAPAYAQTACQVTYQKTWDGGGGFGANVTITNLGAPINGWELTFAFPSNQQISNGWIAIWSQSGQNVTARNESWSANIPSNGSLTLGFNGTYSGSNPDPTTFFLNGVECNGDNNGGGGDEDPSILANPTSLSLAGGSSGSVNFRLSEAPAGSVQVNLSVTGSTAVSVQPTSITFDGGNWSGGVNATVNTVAGPSNATATITASANGYESATVSVTRLGSDDDGDDDNDPPGEDNRVDNPYAGADVYVNPDWRANAQAGGAPSSIFNQPTGVWLDRRAAIESGSAGSNTMGLADHLNEAVAQDAANGSTPLVFQVVIYNLPGRDCAALASNGELGPDDLPIYESEYIDPIANIMDNPEYANLRIVAIIEIDSLPNLVTNVAGRPGATTLCDTMKANGGYVDGVGYALSELGDIPNVYNYIDAAHHGWIGWSDNFGATADIIWQAANANGATPEDVHGFITNTANYSALEEPFIDINGTINGQQIRQSSWIDFNNHNEELSFAQAFRQELLNQGWNSVDSGIGMLIDTSRNGWGGPNRPSGPSASTDLNTFVNESRIDRRIHKGNWCNQAGAGLGERPQANPEPGIDAYVWIKPPGESDGSSEFIENDEGKGFDRMCDPTFAEGTPRNGNSPSGALPNAPLSGHWFQAQFEELLANAFPPVS